MLAMFSSKAETDKEYWQVHLYMPHVLYSSILVQRSLLT